MEFLKKNWLVVLLISTVIFMSALFIMLMFSEKSPVKSETIKVYVTETNTVEVVTTNTVTITNTVDGVVDTPPMSPDVAPPTKYEFIWRLSQGQKINGLSSAGPYPANVLVDTTNTFSFYLSYKVADGIEGICVYSLTKTEDGCWAGQWVQTNPRAWGTVLADKTDDGSLVGQFESDQNKGVKPFFRLKGK